VTTPSSAVKEAYYECLLLLISSYVAFACAERIKYLTMTDATKVWMPDTFFRSVKLCRIMNLLFVSFIS
jgi:hypothetical protein